MDFQLSEEQMLIRDMIRDFVEQHVSKIAAEIDRNHRFPEESVPLMAELGLFGFGMPEEYGGTGADTISYVLATEELAKSSASHAMIMGSQCSLGGPVIAKYACKKLQNRLLPGVISGEKLVCFCLSEPGAGCDAGGQETTAVRDGDNYIINGSKLWITMAPQGSIFLVFAMTDKSKGVKGISCFLVEKDTPGLNVGLPEEKMGMNGSNTCSVDFSGCVVPASNMLGQEGSGFNIAMAALDTGRISCAAISLGLAQAALNATVKYTKERCQFGKPIAANQGVQWMLADMAVRVDCSRMLVYRAAVLKDQGMPYTLEASMAKLHAAETSMFVTERAVQLHGGMGYTKAYPVERYMREAKLTEIFEGTNEVQRIVIAKLILS